MYNILSISLFAGSISFISGTSQNVNLTICVLGILIALQKSLFGIFKLGDRSLANKQISLKTGKLIRELSEISHIRDRKIVQEKLRKFNNEFDELQLSSFTNGFFMKNMSADIEDEFVGENIV